MYDIITNGTDIKTRIISEINNASKSILVAMAFFTDKDIANAIIAAKKKGAFVDVILSSNAQNETVKQMFTNENISLHSFETGDPRGMMHHKFCLIDNRISINGSYNYSYNASQNNVENIQVSDDITIYKQLQAEFDKLKYKIDNEMDVNSDISGIMENNIKPTQISNSVESFTTHLGNLIYSTANINTEVYKLQGYENAKESSGNIDIFTTNFNEIKENIKLYATDDSLTGKKTRLFNILMLLLKIKKRKSTLIKTEKYPLENQPMTLICAN